MASTTNFLAFDLGASSGRAVLGRFDGDRLSLEEVHRFPNGPVRILDSLYWNAFDLFSQMKLGLAKAGQEHQVKLAGLGLDTWGVDFGLLDRAGSLIGNPYHYRDLHTQGILERAFELVPRREIFELTGLQFIQFNSLFQLLAMKMRDLPTLQLAHTFLMMPDLFNYWFTGRKVCEYTIASTSQCYNMARDTWAVALLERFGLPTYIFPEVVQPGTIIGDLLPEVMDEIGLSQTIPVIAPGCHDTASAVAAVPVAEADKAHFAYISSGTWSLVGTETRAPVITDKCLAYNLTNEGGVDRTIRLLKNVTGLWLVQECRRIWGQQGQTLSWAELTQLAAAAPPFTAFVDPDDGSFMAPGDMPARMVDYCQRTGQKLALDRGVVIRSALESMALKYRWVIEGLEDVIGYPISVVHIVGGGAQNKLLNQFAANATGRPVVAGPVEATAIGNILMQMLAAGQISSLEEGRELVRRSFTVETYQPQETAAWDEAYGRFKTLVKA